MPKLNIIEWIRSFRLRQFDHDHAIVVKVYDNGRVIFRGERLADDDYAPKPALGVANGILSEEYGKFRREEKQKLARRRKGL